MENERNASSEVKRLATIELSAEQAEVLAQSLGDVSIKYIHVDEYVGSAAARINPSLISARMVVACW